MGYALDGGLPRALGSLHELQRCGVAGDRRSHTCGLHVFCRWADQRAQTLDGVANACGNAGARCLASGAAPVGGRLPSGAQGIFDALGLLADDSPCFAGGLLAGGLNSVCGLFDALDGALGKLKGDVGGQGRVGQQFFQAAGTVAVTVACGAVLLLRILLTGSVGVDGEGRRGRAAEG